MKAVAAVGAASSAVLLGAAGLVTMAAAATMGGLTAPSAGPSAAAPSPAALQRIPATMLVLYERASATCAGLPWAVVAAIGTIESDNGRSDAPGVHSGSNTAGAEGPMQFEPATFATYSRPVPPGGVRPPDPYDPTDAVYATARDLCADGGAGGRDIPGAVYDYNHSTTYVDDVLGLAATYEQAGGPTAATGPAAVAVQWALAQVGTPYVWGGETPGVGFDCSGLVQAAWAAAGVALPRVAQDQYDAGPIVPTGDALRPGDLVYFGASPAEVTHVGMYLGIRDGQPTMVDAPHTGAYVRIESFPDVVGAAWGSDVYVGATRPR